MPTRLLNRRFVSLGEAMVELAPTGQPDTFTMGFAGDTLNTAWYLRRALPGWQVDYATAIGSDATSDRMLAFLAKAGLGTAHVARLTDRTVGLYLIELRDGERSFSYWRGQSAARLVARDPARLARALEGAGVVYVSGITLAVVEPEDRPALFDALQSARQAGALIVFDPNLRLRLWPDTATMCACVMQAGSLSDIVLPSHDDEAVAFGDTSVEATARRYAQAGADLVVVKNGGGEMLTLSGGSVARHAPEPVTQVVDSTAAGDSFNAGFLAAHLDGRPLAEAVRAGARTAAQVIARRGALVEIGVV